MARSFHHHLAVVYINGFFKSLENRVFNFFKNLIFKVEINIYILKNRWRFDDFFNFWKKRKDFILFLELFIEKLKLQSYAKIDVFYL